MVRSIYSIINPYAKPLSVSVWVFLSVMVINSCDSIQTSLEVSNTNSAVAVQITKVSPMSAKPNETLSLSGTGFNTVKNPTVRLTMSDGSVKKTLVLVTSSTAASFVMPEGIGLGLKSATLMSGSTKEVTSFKLVADQMSNDLPIIIDEQSEICTTKKYIDRNGETQTGTKICSGASTANSCTSDGDSNCYLPAYVANTQPLKAISYDSLNSNASSILSGTTIGGVPGTLTIPDPWDVRAGITAAGVSGQLKTNCRNGGSTLTFGMGAIKSATVANGADTLTVTSHGYQTGTVVWIDYTTQPTGLSQSTNYYVIKDNNDSFKLATSAANAFTHTAFTPTAINITADGSGVIVWQAGATAKPATGVDTTNGTLTVTGHGYSSTQVVQVSSTTPPVGLLNSTTYYVIVVDANTIKLATTPTNAAAGTATPIASNGSGVYVYSLGTGTLSVTDTIDDRNNLGAILTSHPWSSSNNFCGGVEAMAGDSNVWKDVTSGGGCASNPSGCRMKDKISGLEWTKTQSTSLTWGKAMDLCNVLTFDSMPGWRLPTQKELMDAYNHGIRSAASSNWITQSEVDGSYFWSGSSLSLNTNTNFAWAVLLANGYTANGNKQLNTYQVICVR